MVSLLNFECATKPMLVISFSICHLSLSLSFRRARSHACSLNLLHRYFQLWVIKQKFQRTSLQLFDTFNKYACDDVSADFKAFQHLSVHVLFQGRAICGLLVFMLVVFVAVIFNCLKPNIRSKLSIKTFSFDALKYVYSIIHTQNTAPGPIETNEMNFFLLFSNMANWWLLLLKYASVQNMCVCVCLLFFYTLRMNIV